MMAFVFTVLAQVPSAVAGGPDKVSAVPSWEVQLVLFALAAGLTMATLRGARLWRDAVMKHSLLSDDEKLQSKDAVVVLAQAVLVLLLTGYLALAATGLCFPGKWAPIGIVLVWVAVGQTVGWGLGFLFGHPEIIERENPDDKRTRRVKQNSSLAQVTDWLTKAIVGVGLVQAQDIMRWVNRMATELGGALDGVDRAASGSAGYALMLAVLVVFPILGFLTGYLVTRTFIVLALCRADVAASGAANPEWQSEQAKFEISDSEFQEVDRAELMLGDDRTVVAERVREALAKVTSHPLAELVSWRHIRLWAKAKVMLALEEDGTVQAELAKDAERGFHKAHELVPNDAETRLGLAVALSLQDGKKREILSELEAARDSLMAKSGPDLWKNVYKSLIYRYLYLPEPESFTRALAASREYLLKPGMISSGGIWVNVACAYGLAASWLAADEKRTLDIKEMGILSGPEGADNASPKARQTWLRAQAVRAAKEAIGRDAKWLEKLRELAGLEAGKTEDKDLAVVAEEIAKFTAP